MKLTLKVTQGPNTGKTFTFESHDLFLVGRALEAHFSLLDDPYFSRVHFMVEFNPPLCRIMDLNSRNGTEVNGRKIDRAIDLQDGDAIKGGGTQLEVSLKKPPTMPTLSLPPAAIDVDPWKTTSKSVLKQQDDKEVPSATGLSSMPGFPVVPGYQILQQVGQGGMGVVYKAERQGDGLPVAIKTILPAIQADEIAVNRFLREAEILKQLQHAHIVAFLDVGQVGDLLYFAMEFVPGPSLSQVRRGHVGAFPVGRAVRLICQVLEALAHAHSRGFVHRDIKPANVLVVGKGEAEQAKLADFGLARAYHDSPLSGLTMSGVAAGTPQYMPPEQVLDFRSVKPAGDQYAAAALLYYLLTGQILYPLAADVASFLRLVLSEDPRPIADVRPGLPAPLTQAIAQGLKRKPQERFAGVELFRQALLPYTSL